MSHPSQITGKVRRKVKSGCRTCKIRKVKCDEDRPACQRCLKSGRKCDGYGIWGGGGSPVNHSNTCAAIRKPGLGPPAHGNCYSILALSRSPRAYPVFSVPPHQDEIEAMAFDWFKSRTAPKLPGSYHSRFWDTLIFQATVGDEAVRHTALALGSFHRTRIMCVKDCAETSTDYLPAREGKFMLQHYITAISQLRQLLSTKDKSSYRVALVVCIMFTALDFLRGHLAAAQLHLRNGLNVLAELQGTSSLATNPGPHLLTHCLGQEDCWIAEAYSRLHLQMQLWKPRREKQMFSLLGHDAALSSAAVGFRSLPDAWQGWEVIMNHILTVTEQARSQSEAMASLIGKQVSLRSELDRWLERYEYTDFGLPPLSTEKADALIRSFHSMAKIMVEICLQPGDEMAYDSQTDQFVEMLEHLLRLLTGKGGHSIVYGGRGPESGNRFAWSIVDFGNIQPLYYIAIKCRVHRVRLQAVRLLEACSHREGIWESWAAACVARKVMELEENGELLGPSEEFPLVRCPQLQELSEPELPASQRICDVEIEMEGTPMDTILLFGYKDDERVLLSTYNSFLMAWEDM